MIKTIKAKYADGVLAPLEPLTSLNLTEGDEVLVTVSLQPGLALSYEKLTKDSMAAAGGWAASIDGEELIRRIYTSRHRGFDCDCIYCTPKK